MSLELIKNAIDKGFEPSNVSTQDIQQWLVEKKGILVLVDYEYECDSTPYFYKIYKFIDENGKCESWPIKGCVYSGSKSIEAIVGCRDYGRSYGDYHTYNEAIEAGITEALKMLE